MRRPARASARTALLHMLVIIPLTPPPYRFRVYERLLRAYRADR